MQPDDERMIAEAVAQARAAGVAELVIEPWPTAPRLRVCSGLRFTS